MKTRTFNRPALCWSIVNGSTCLFTSVGVVKENEIPQQAYWRQKHIVKKENKYIN